MNKIPCASQNSGAKTLPADVCIFGHFGRLSPATVPSADSRFDPRVKWWIHVLSIVIYLYKNFFLLHWNSSKQRSELSMLYCFWSSVSKRSTHFKQNFLIDKCSCKIVNTLPSDIFDSSAIPHNFNLSIRQNEFVKFFVFRDNCWIWVIWAFSIICICTTTFKVSIPLLHHCFWWRRVWVTLIKPLLCLNSIFSHQKAKLYQHMKFRFFHCFENLQLQFHLNNSNL